MALLTINEQQAIKPISPNWSKSVKTLGGVTKFEQLCNEVEESKLSVLLGIALYQDLADNPTTPENVILLGGGTYTDSNNNTIKFKGLKYVLAYMNYSQIISESFVEDTATGFVKKDRNETTTLSSSERKELKLSVENIALNQFELVRRYLNNNSTLYPLWVCGASKTPYKPVLRGIKKTRH